MNFNKWYCNVTGRMYCVLMINLLYFLPFLDECKELFALKFLLLLFLIMSNFFFCVNSFATF